MNKKWIKIIDFLNMIHSGEKPPEKIIISGHRYKYNEKSKDYDSDIGFDNKDLFLHIGILKELDTEIAILEDNTEEIEELDRELKFNDLVEPYGKNEDMMWTEIIKQHNKIDEIIRYIKRKDKNND